MEPKRDVFVVRVPFGNVGLRRWKTLALAPVTHSKIKNNTNGTSNLVTLEPIAKIKKGDREIGEYFRARGHVEAPMPRLAQTGPLKESPRASLDLVVGASYPRSR